MKAILTLIEITEIDKSLIQSYQVELGASPKTYFPDLEADREKKVFHIKLSDNTNVGFLIYSHKYLLLFLQSSFRLQGILNSCASSILEIVNHDDLFIKVPTGKPNYILAILKKFHFLQIDKDLYLRAKASSEIKFGNTYIGGCRPTFVIAEIGINHEGSYDKCVEMIKSASRAGANAIKLQTIDADKNYVLGTESYNIFKGSELTRDETARIFDLTRSLRMEPFTTSGDVATIDWVDRLEPAGHKISSGLLNATPIVDYIISKGRSIICSTGLSTWTEASRIMQKIIFQASKRVAMMHCTSLYPCSDEHLRLAMISVWERFLGIPVGFSDHSIGEDASIFSVMQGAKLIEKHFTFDTGRKGYDHPISLDEKGFSSMVRGIRNAEDKIGKNSFHFSENWLLNREKFLRCIVAGAEVKKGELFSSSNVSIKRPLPAKRGLEPEFYETILGKTSKINLLPGDPICRNDFEG